jgi:hypothetical protein
MCRRRRRRRHIALVQSMTLLRVCGNRDLPLTVHTHRCLLIRITGITKYTHGMTLETSVQGIQFHR